MKIFSLFLFICFASFCQAQDNDKDNPGKLKNVKHYIVFQEDGQFAGWPANNGAFLTANGEMVVGFTKGRYVVSGGHNIQKPYTSWLARSIDGGKSWSAYDPANYVGDFGDQPALKVLESPIDFSNPDFMMRMVGIGYHGAEDPKSHFFYSDDAGQNWKGPFGFGDLANHPELKKYDLNELTPRTDYLVEGKNECLVFISARKKDVFATDRLFCARTSDGGQSFEFIGWVVKPFDENEKNLTERVPLYNNEKRNPVATECRAVMSQTVRLSDGQLVSAIRRKFIVKGGSDKQWIDVYKSEDGGRTWTFLSMVANTGPENGNPPAMALCDDGRLCVIYGERKNGTIQVVYSADNGSSWTSPKILIDDFWSEDMELNDLGYPRLLKRPDGKLVALYYYSSKDHLHHIGASIWKP